MKRFKIFIVAIITFIIIACGSVKPLYYYSNTSNPNHFIDSVCNIHNITPPTKWDSIKLFTSDSTVTTQYVYTGTFEKDLYIFSIQPEDSTYIVKIKKTRK